MDIMEIDAENRELQNDTRHRSKKGQLKSKLLRFVIGTTVFFCIVMVALVFGQSVGKQKSAEKIEELTRLIEEKDQEIKELNETPIVVSPVAPTISLDIIKSEIKEIGELATAEYLFTDAAKYSDSKQINNWNIPFTEKSFVMKWDGIIKAGIQIESVDVTVDEEGMRIAVSLPEAEILSYEVDNVEVVDEKDNILNSITVDDTVKFDEKTKEAMIKRAIENGLLEKATRNAENLITNILKANPAIGESYTIEFTNHNP